MKATMTIRCTCKHSRMCHAGATPQNNGGNECRLCDCPVFESEIANALNATREERR